MPRLLLVDGHFVFHRAYHADMSSDRRTPDGDPCWAVHGFGRMLLEAIGYRRPTHMAVCFDVTGPGRAGRRRAEFPAYKANRSAPPPDMLPQDPLVRRFVDLLGIATYEADGFEADDMIGTIARLATAVRPAENYGQVTGFGVPLTPDVEILTGDRDLFQLVRPGVRVLLPPIGRRENGTPWVEEYDEAAVHRRMGVRPDQIVDLKALEGDVSDNLPGVPGIGHKTAVDLLDIYGSFDALYADDRELFKKGLRRKLTAGRDLAMASRRLATIDCDAPVYWRLDDCRLRGPSPELDGWLRATGLDDLAEMLVPA